MGEVADLLEENFANLAHPEHGIVLSLVFLMGDGPDGQMLRRHIGEAVEDLLKRHGLIKDDEPAPDPNMQRITCNQCGGTLAAFTGRPINGRVFLSEQARRNPECPHQVVTADDQRRLIEEAVAREKAEATT